MEERESKRSQKLPQIPGRVSPAARMMIVAVGECARDRYPDRGVEAVGGISLNFAIHARRSGATRVALVSCIGTDGTEAPTRAKLDKEGVDGTHLHTVSGVSASQMIRIADGGERIFPPEGYDPGVLATFHLSAADEAFIGTFDVVAAPYFRQVKHLFTGAMDAAAPDAKRVADLLDGEDLGAELAGIDPLLNALDLVFLSGDEGTVDLLLPRSRQSRTLIVVTHGAGGSSALAGGVRHIAGAVPVPVAERIDTTGCGDAFQAAFTVSFFQHGVVARALQAGAMRAAQVIRHLGAT